MHVYVKYIKSESIKIKILLVGGTRQFDKMLSTVITVLIVKEINSRADLCVMGRSLTAMNL